MSSRSYGEKINEAFSKNIKIESFYAEHTLDIYLIDTPDLTLEDIAGGEARGSCHLRAKILYVAPQKSSYRSGRANVQALRLLLRDLTQSLQALHRYFPESKR